MKKTLIILVILCMVTALSCQSTGGKSGGGSGQWDVQEYVPETVLYFENMEGNLGPMNLRNQDTQMGWLSDGTDGKSGHPIEKFTEAKFLVLQLTNKPIGGLQVIWQGDSDNWNWNQNDGVISNSGVPNAAKGAVLSDSLLLTIDLSVALNKFEMYKTNNQAKVILGYYSNNIADLGITKADFLY